MSTLTHCMPSGSLGTNEIPVCNVGDANVSANIPAGGLGNGNIRGVVVGMGGLPDGISAISGGVSTAAIPSFANNLNLDGWIVLGVPYPESWAGGSGATAIWNDANSDSGHGSRYLNNQLHWWDHVIEYVHLKYGATIPIVAWGGSWGGFHTLMMASYKTSTLIGYYADIPATIISNANPVYTNPANYGSSPVTTAAGTVLPALTGGTGGMDASPTALNTVNIPGIVTYGTDDTAIGWGYPGTASLSPSGGLASNAYISLGLPYSYTDQIIANAQAAGMPVIRNQTANNHDFSNQDAGLGAVFTPTGPTALSALSRLQIQATPALQFTPPNSLSDFNSGQTAIWASDNQWHTITFTNFHFNAFTSTTVTNVATSLPSTLTLNSTTGLYLTSGTNYVRIFTTGTACIASYTGVSGNNLTGVSYVSGSGNIVGGAISLVNLINYVTQTVSDVTSIPSTLTLNTNHGLDPAGGQLYIATSSVFAPLLINYGGVSGSTTITGVSYVSGGGSLGGTPANAVTLQTSLVGCSYSGNNSATVSANAPVCMTGMPVASGSYYKMSMSWWFSQYLDPIAPRQY